MVRLNFTIRAGIWIWFEVIHYFGGMDWSWFTLFLNYLSCTANLDPEDCPDIISGIQLIHLAKSRQRFLKISADCVAAQLPRARSDGSELL